MTRPKFYSREEWGAREPEPGPGFLTPSRVEGIALHWPGTPSRILTTYGVKRALRGWQAYHMDTQGWSDIAYQAAVDQRGNRYRLRGLRRQSGANGDTDVNERFGALLLVLAIGETPSGEMVRAVRRTVADFRDLYPGATRIVPHSAIRPEATACPGDITRSLIARGTFNPNRKA